jgi:peptidase S24-like protein/CI repressor-like protein
MARKKTPIGRVNARAALSSRLRAIRHELLGYHGGPELARRLNLPARTWYNYETGVTVPAEVLLAFVEATDANPSWLLTGEGPKFRNSQRNLLSESTSGRFLRRSLDRSQDGSQDAEIATHETHTGESTSDCVSLALVPLSALSQSVAQSTDSVDRVMAFRQWIPNPRETVAVRIDDDAMDPILPVGTVVAIDRSVIDPGQLQGRLVAACPHGRPMIRWLEISGRHLILRPHQPSREYPMVPIEREAGASLIIGHVVWSWSHYGGAEASNGSGRKARDKSTMCR